MGSASKDLIFRLPRSFLELCDHSVCGVCAVKSFGTEDRRQDGTFLPPSGEIYEYIIFKGALPSVFFEVDPGVARQSCLRLEV